MQAAQAVMYRRGWRNFMNATEVDATVNVVIGDTRIPVQADRGGYIDVRVRNPGLAPGWHSVRLEGVRGASTMADVQVIGHDVSFGIVSDIDDTIITTLLPRPLLAAWNSFVLTEQARQAVPAWPVSTSSSSAPTRGAHHLRVDRVLEHLPDDPALHGTPRHPAGAILFTDWGPTQTGWFRSGPDHKRRCLRELARDLPGIRWLLVGDDGQHDPDLYAEFASLQPEHVRARAIRQLTPGEHTLAHGLPMEVAPEARWEPDIAPEVRAPDGDGLADGLSELLG
ncbi:phosphatase domain-containing protein [Tessaracoccus coleopterorum]|uniref:phosphatase domain-containing protein n=1 Tax=Tessaracoccus coleopterorum TaxID=2714950 RepID=UPI002F9078A1